MPLDYPLTLEWLRGRLPEALRTPINVATADVVTGEGYPVWYTFPERTIVSLSDVVTTLTRVCRYGGARPWSVAQHSLLCVLIFDCVCQDPGGWADLRVQALSGRDSAAAGLPDLRRSIAAHDAAEYVLGDPSTHLKPILGRAYRDLEYLWRLWINQSLRIQGYLEADWETRLEKEIDRAALLTEAYMLHHHGYPVMLARNKFPAGFVPDQLVQNLFRSVLALPLPKLEERLTRAIRGHG